ncbi:DUF3085 domain-containing protein, partial [Burkholderia sp. AU45251]|uniref:DUF3085 domain-containing protein n=1 Tax=Burkholderia sp. AU45251 TaxID=3059204 RepID=UPI00265195BC
WQTRDSPLGVVCARCLRETPTATSRKLLKTPRIPIDLRAHAQLGGDDFGEFFDPKEGVFARILHGTDDLMLSATTTHLSLEVVPSV